MNMVVEVMEQIYKFKSLTNNFRNERTVNINNVKVYGMFLNLETFG